MPRNLAFLIAVLMVLFSSVAFAATITVTTNADSGPGSLRDAIMQAAANGTAQTDNIVFNIADLSLAGRTITLENELPALSSNVVIDGTTQPGGAFAVTEAKIVIRKIDYAYTFSMLRVANATNVKIYGLYLYWGYWLWIFNAPPPTAQIYGLEITNAFNVEFGAPGKGNVVNGFNCGIFSGINSDSCRNIKVRSNFFGQGIYYLSNTSADIDSYMFDLRDAIALVNVRDCTIGGPTPAEGNTICGQQGITMDSKYQTGNGFITIQNNKFSRWYDKTTLHTFGHFASYFLHVGIDASISHDLHSTTTDYYVQVLDNDIPMSAELDHLTTAFVIQRNHFDNDVRDLTIGVKLLITDCPGGGLIGGDDPANANYFRTRAADDWSYESVLIGDVMGPVTNLKNVYECNSIFGSTTRSINYETPYVVPFAQIGTTTAASVTGTATPQCRIDLYYDDECTACEGKIYIGKTSSDDAGNWQYTGPTNGTVVATATDATGRTGDFSAPRFYTSQVKVVQPSCGKSNGSITNITSDGAETFYWKNLTTGLVVSNSLDLTNAGPGEYVLYGVHGFTCIKPLSQSIGLADQTPVIMAQNVSVTQPGCGQFNGSITNIYVSETNNVKYSWINAQRAVVGSQSAINGLGPGQYKLIVSDSVTGCQDSTAFYDLINQSGPSLNINAAVITAASCNLSNGAISNIIITNTTGNSSYTWLNATGNIVGTGLSLSGVPSGSYVLKFKDGSSCDTITTPAIQIGSVGVVSINTGAIQITASKCSSATGSILNITAGIGATYKWIDTVSRQTVGNSANLNNVLPGYYRLIVTSTAGCIDSAGPVNVPQDGLIPLTAAFDSRDETCERKNGSITITSLTPSVTGYSFQWTTTAGNLVGTGAAIQSLTSGYYTVYATDENGCRQMLSTLFVADDPAPAIDAVSIIPNICNEKNGMISLSVNGSSPFVYSWMDGAGQTISQSAVLNARDAGSYSAKVTDANGCVTSTPVYVITDSTLLIEPPVYVDQIVLKGNPATLKPSSTATGDYLLYASIGADASQQNANGSFVTGPVSEDTTVYISVGEGSCSSVRVPVHIQAVQTLEITMPNSFSPNNDGHNDIFRVKYPQGIKKFSMAVFNRWGQKVFESADPYRGWDGTYKGALQPVDTYVWFISYEDILGDSKKISGSLVLVR